MHRYSYLTEWYTFTLPPGEEKCMGCWQTGFIVAASRDAGKRRLPLNVKRTLLIATSAFFLSVGAANAQIVVRIGPPPPHPVEVAPPPPHEGWVWVPGYHRWDGHAYVWVPGEYRNPPHRGAVWVPGEWREERGGHVWHEGHWK
jgi:hypothetical protein